MKALIKSDEGQTLVWVALTLVVLLGAAALAIDFGNAYFAKRRMQNAADAGALAGAGELCLGKDPDDANSMAEEYAVARNGADWATPVPSGDSMTVTAIEQVDYVLARVLVDPDFVMVAAHAKAECQSPSTGIPTLPLTIQHAQFNRINCGDTIWITLENAPTMDPCPDGCDCDHVFTGQSTDTNSERGWFEGTNICNTGTESSCQLKAAMPWNATCAIHGIHIGSCLDDKTGAVMGVWQGAGGKELIDWVNAGGGQRTVHIPMFDYFGPDCNGVTGCKGYRVSGFACVDFQTAPDPPGAYDKKGEWPALDGQECVNDKGKPYSLSKAVVGKVRCDCTISGGFPGGPEDPNLAKIPVLIQ